MSCGYGILCNLVVFCFVFVCFKLWFLLLIHWSIVSFRTFVFADIGVYRYRFRLYIHIYTLYTFTYIIWNGFGCLWFVNLFAVWLLVIGLVSVSVLVSVFTFRSLNRVFYIRNIHIHIKYISIYANFAKCKYRTEKRECTSSK